ncbi:MAG: hypothetical protein ACOX45_08145 [Acutalibacteraceae bacterium]
MIAPKHNTRQFTDASEGELKAGETALSELEAETVYLFTDRQEPVETVGPNGETEVFSDDYYNSVYTKGLRCLLG